MSVVSVVLRPARTSDAEILAQIACQSLPEAWTVAGFVESLTQPCTRCWVATQSHQQVVGFILYWVTFDESQIVMMAVLPEYRRKKLGTALLKTALASSTQEGVRRWMLEVRQSNISAQQLYHQFGFVQDGVRPQYYQNPTEDALLMSRQHDTAHYLASGDAGDGMVQEKGSLLVE